MGSIISQQQQSKGYEYGPWKDTRPSLPLAADFQFKDKQ
jgi:hypothetical protein